MSGILDGLMQELGSGGIDAIASKLGVDSGQAESALQSALPMIVGALAHNATDPQGADALHNALQQHASPGSVQQQIQQATENPGANEEGSAILNHNYGHRQEVATQGVSQVSGLDLGNAGALLSMLAPLVMGYLGRHVAQNGMDSGQLSNVLGQQASSIQNGGGIAGSLINAVLGHSGSGGLDMSSILSAGSSILGAFNKR
jgi:hypothetical protein